MKCTTTHKMPLTFVGELDSYDNIHFQTTHQKLITREINSFKSQLNILTQNVRDRKFETISVS